ncbi:hypothetical protein GGR50DRAFT_359255 [Xylaria sp. CBS 124048]|nr:hypothetical protein GGR50DRAFT_359255 [Xylaria sp. CBS 124048]
MAAGDTVWRPQVNTVVVLATFLFIASTSAKDITSQFKHFYPQHAKEYEYFLQNNCSQEYANYLTGRPRDFQEDTLTGGGPKTVLIQPVVNCLLENASEYIKAASASAQVILGLAPPVLATMGAKTDELAILAVFGDKHLLSLLLSIGSPSVYMERVFDFGKPKELLMYAPRRYYPTWPSKRSRTQKWVIAALEHIFAVAAVTNIAILTWDLGAGTVCTFWPNTVYAILTWAALRIPLHLGGIVALRCRLRRNPSETPNEPKAEAPEDSPGIVRSWLSRMSDVFLLACEPAVFKDDIETVESVETLPYIVLSWILSAATAVHILFGSLVFSSLLFIGPSDAVKVIARYVGSVIACRIIVAFELMGMRERVFREEQSREGQPDSSESTLYDDS